VARCCVPPFFPFSACACALTSPPPPPDLRLARALARSPFMWVDARGHWHSLFHKMFDPPGQGPCGTWAGGHAFSADGTAWSPIYRAYNTTLSLEGGGTLTVQRRERPKFLFGPNMQPTHLYNGVITSLPGSGTYTAVAPLNVPQ
jgi:hypothetical protein